MKRHELIMVAALCLILITSAGGVAESLAGGVSSLPGYEDALAAARGESPGVALPGSLRSLAGYHGALARWREMPGATVYSGTIQRAYTTTPCYTLTYTDASQTHTVYLPANNITTIEAGMPALPNTIPNPVAVDYVGPIDYNTYTLDFRYQGVYYHAKWATTCPVKSPYIGGDANHCNPPLHDTFFGTVYLTTYDAAGNEVKTPAPGVVVHVYVYMWGTEGDEGVFHYGPTTTDSKGKWSMTFDVIIYGSAGYATYSLPGYPPGQDDIDWSFCVED